MTGLLETDYTIGAFDGANYDEFFSSPIGSVKRDIAETILTNHPSTKITKYEDAHEKMLNERFAYVESVNLMNVLNKDNCLFTQIPYEFKIYRVAIGFSKTFPYASLFNNAISQTKEAGGLQRILKKWAIKTRTD